MSHYSLLFDEIKTRVLAGYNTAGYVFEGKPNRYTAQLPHLGIQLSSVQRVTAGRSVEQVWSWSLNLIVGIQDNDTGSQEQSANLAEAVIIQLCPFTTTGTPPASPSPFAGIGYQMQCPSWEPIELEAEKRSVGVQLEFSVRTTVWQ